ncbi:MAG TPA: hypothetical protein PLP29_16810 [Candidatus Ozemobacteraceae bacterium]|nr:hypothetical protein [Candidatus Ozemobacteraceae bacterium]
MTSSRSGVTIYMVLAILLGLVIIGTTFTLNSLRKITPPPFLLEQKADYQMESAFVLCLAKLDQLPEGGSNEPLLRQEIAPGAWLSVTATPAGPRQWNLDARVTAEHWSRGLLAQATKRAPDVEAPIASPTLSPDGTASASMTGDGPAVHTPGWSLRFLAAESPAAPPAEAGRTP